MWLSNYSDFKIKNILDPQYNLWTDVAFLVPILGSPIENGV